VEDELVGGNALLEMGTFLAILLGTLLAGVLASYHDVPMLIGVLLLIALAGLGVSAFIPRTAPVAPDLRIDGNLLRSSLANMRAARVDQVVFLAILGISWFWFYGALVLAQLPLYAKLTLNGTETVVTLMLLGFSLGVGTGSLLCERLSGHRLEIGLVPFGSLGLTAFGIDLYFATPSAPAPAPVSWAGFLVQSAGWHVILDLTLIGVFGGLYIVP